ncbi:MAG: hypothetical protein AAGA96_14015 [Verrucomicrobiota bacterium]
MGDHLYRAVAKAACWCVVVAGGLSASQQGMAQAFNDFDLPPHDYYLRQHEDALSRLLRKAEKGEYDFGFQTGLPFLKKMLRDLNIAESSQVLLFSQTSLQRRSIGPGNPRALYFNEDTHVAWIPGGKMEIISFDPSVGGLFFLEKSPETPAEKVSFTRRDSCFGCHGGSATNFLPGPLGRSHFTGDTGSVLGQVPGHTRVGHAVAFEDRWGGYYVTGSPSSMEHLGNAFYTREEGRFVKDPIARSSREDLTQFFDPVKLPRSDSNVVPLMVFDHQIEAQNLILEAVYRDRNWHHEAAKWGEPLGKTRADSNKLFDRLVRYLLFADEVPFNPAGLLASSDFMEDFVERSKTDDAGNSLRHFHLQGRLFKTRLSYMIHSRMFEEAPPSMKERVYDRLWAILSPKNPPDGFDYFEPGERERIIGILRATKDDLPYEWNRSLAHLGHSNP